MSIPQLTSFPDPPRIYQPEEEFDAKADEMAGHLPVLVNEINAMVAGSNAAWADIDTKTSAATNAATTASNAAAAADTSASNAELFKQAAASSANSAGNSASAALSFKNAAADSATDAANSAAAAAASVTPAGTIIFYAKSTQPTGYLKANGAAVSRTTYAALFAVIGTVFGAGDGSTTFNLPDFRADFLRGWDDGRGVDAGRIFGSSQTDAFQDHLHTPAVYNSATGIAGGNNNFLSSSFTTASSATNYDPYPADPTILPASYNGPGGIGHNLGYRTATETRPRNVAMLACIKY